MIIPKYLYDHIGTHYCIICGRYCTHQHHLVPVANGSKRCIQGNEVYLCRKHHRALHAGKIKIYYSKLSDENKTYIANRKITGNTIDWRK